MAKLFASETLEKVASDAVQIHGGYGYMNDYPVSRIYKGAKSSRSSKARRKSSG